MLLRSTLGQFKSQQTLICLVCMMFCRVLLVLLALLVSQVPVDLLDPLALLVLLAPKETMYVLYTAFYYTCMKSVAIYI